MILDDAELLEKARQLDTDALAQIHDRYYGPVFSYIVFRVSQRELAEDMASEVFLRFLRALHARQAPQSTLRGWLFSVAGHIVNDHHRHSYRHPQVQISDALEHPGGSLDSTIEVRMLVDDLRRAVTELTDEQQQIIALRFGSELPIQDVARTLGKTEGAVKQLQARAVAALARIMKARVDV
jgi:RNA polymerase sigma-70 factor (ECF subfamily)